ncbi:MAG: flagellar hook-associated protein FlgL [Bdellovibrionia bacterium]
MRITDNANYDSVKGAISRSKEKMGNLQFQSTTLKKLNTPSDNPVGASKVLELRTDKMNNDQYQMNSKMAETFLNNTESAVADLAEIIARAKEIAIAQSSTSTSSESTRVAVSEEINQLYKQAIGAANRKVGERYLLGGYKTQKAPVDEQGNYHGDDGQMMVEVAKDVFLTMNIPGIEAFNTQPKVAYAKQNGYGNARNNDPVDQEEILENVNIFDELQNFRIGLLTGNMEAIHSTLERFDLLHSRLVTTQAKLGSRIQGLSATSQSIDRQNITNASLTSELEDADMAQVVSDMGKEEGIYKSSLASSRRLIQPTLLDFLK